MAGQKLQVLVTADLSWIYPGGTGYGRNLFGRMQVENAEKMDLNREVVYKDVAVESSHGHGMEFVGLLSCGPIRHIHHHPLRHLASTHVKIISHQSQFLQDAPRQ
jgi:hypothetical protein